MGMFNNIYYLYTKFDDILYNKHILIFILFFILMNSVDTLIRYIIINLTGSTVYKIIKFFNILVIKLGR